MCQRGLMNCEDYTEKAGYIYFQIKDCIKYNICTEYNVDLKNSICFMCNINSAENF